MALQLRLTPSESGARGADHSAPLDSMVLERPRRNERHVVEQMNL